MRLSKLQEFMRERYRFDANESQFKYQIKKWNMQKNIPRAKKAAMIDMRVARPESTIHGTFKYKGHAVDDKKLRRHVKETIRMQRTSKIAPANADALVPISIEASKIVLSWNMPYGAMKAAHPSSLDHFSPFATVSTPSDICMATPQSNNAASPQTGLSPLSHALERKKTMSRAHLFLEGKRDELMKSMTKSERQVASTWLYQFWLFSFKTAKAWGHGPRRWNADFLAFDKYAEIVVISNANTPGQLVENDVCEAPRPHRHQGIPKPGDLCSWSIHTNQLDRDMEPVALDMDESLNHPLDNPENEASWTKWPKSWHQPDMPSVLRNGLESNDFSNLNTDTLPMNVPEVLRVTPRAPNELLRESFAFSIMSRNIDLVEELLHKMKAAKASFEELYPYHLATTYLEGSKTCCNILDLLTTNLGSEQSLQKLRYNDLGHSVMDTLMISVIKSHTTCMPGLVEHRWAKERRFPGAEIDICGRWDADSDCIRALLADGDPTIPNEWKHRFCHTSAQTILHCLTSLVERDPDTLLVSSGLFLKRCLCCGLKLELLPLHIIVLTSFALAEYGLPGDDLFGMVACLLCLLSNGARSLQKAPVSISALFEAEQGDVCDHEMFDALELLDTLRAQASSLWSKEVTMGWEILAEILRRSKRQWDPSLDEDLSSLPSPSHVSNSSGLDEEFETAYGAGNDTSIIEHSTDDDNSEDDKGDASETSTIYDLDIDTQCHGALLLDEHDNYFGKDRLLGELWAVVRTELLTYRQVTAESARHSSHFSMQNVYESLKENKELRIGLTDDGLMAEHCRCGKFERECGGHATMEDVSQHYFANLEDWTRITVIPLPARLLEDFW